MTLMDLLIRKAVPEDAAEINSVLKRAFKNYEKAACYNAAKGALEETTEKTLEDIKNKLFLAAELDGKIAGSVRVESLNESVAYLSRFSVLPEYHKFGTGKKLINEVFRILKEKNVRELYLHTSLDVTYLISFYESCGFTVESVSEDRGYKRAKLKKDLW